MSSTYIDIEGSAIRRRLRDANLPGGTEKTCCGGRKIFNRDYATQLKALNMCGNFNILERGILVDKVVVK